MGTGEQAVLIALAAFAAGVALGKLWTRLARGRHPLSRRRWGDSLHYILGIDFLASRQIDRAIAELTRAARADTEAVEIYLILGNLLREKGQLERAIQIHRSILHRPGLAPRERAHALLCLGIDFKRAGFRQRAMETFEEVLRLDGDNQYALLHLIKIHEEEHNWEAALALQQKVAAQSREANGTVAAFLHDQTGQSAWAAGDEKRALRSFETALDLNRSLALPRIHLGDVHAARGRWREAAASWEALTRHTPEQAYLVFDRLANAYGQLGDQEEIERFYRDIMARDDKDWRAHLAMARKLAADGHAAQAFPLLLSAVENNPHAIVVHMIAWEVLLQDGLKAERVRRYLEAVQGAVLFLDPHVCIKCHYRADGLLWRCPHCQEWNTFVEERLTSRQRTGSD